jgi:hypothetical protein
MVEIKVFEAGGYRYIPGVFQYSAGVAAEPGFQLERVRFRKPLPIIEGFAAAEHFLASIGRSVTAFCACELRSPEPFTEDGFRSFNRDYVGTLERWGIFRNEENPVARTNICPEFAKPKEPVMYAFSYTAMSKKDDQGAGFIIAGSGEAIEGKGSYKETIVRLGETSQDALRDKTRAVLGEMERRLLALGFGWDDAAYIQAYTVHDIGFLMQDEFTHLGSNLPAITWLFSRPPVVNIEFEMDVRGAVVEKLA